MTDRGGDPATASPGPRADDPFAELARTGNEQLRAEIVEAHLGLARHLAHRFARRGESEDDLFQVASMALVRAVDRFDPAVGAAFSTFATRTIVGELKRHFRDRAWAVRAPRRVQELYLRLGASIEHLSQVLGRSPTIAELAADTDSDEESVLQALEAGQAYRTASLDAPVPGVDDETLGDRMGETDDGFLEAERRAQLAPLLDRLPERERRIVALRFVAGMTQSEIAAQVGISQMHVSRLLSRSLARLRGHILRAEAAGERDAERERERNEGEGTAPNDLSTPGPG